MLLGGRVQEGGEGIGTSLRTSRKPEGRGPLAKCPSGSFQGGTHDLKKARVKRGIHYKNVRGKKTPLESAGAPGRCDNESTLRSLIQGGQRRKDFENKNLTKRGLGKEKAERQKSLHSDQSCANQRGEGRGSPILLALLLTGCIRRGREAQRRVRREGCRDTSGRLSTRSPRA